MTILKDYHHFNGVNMETGAIANALAYQGVRAPHTGQPISEALLFGVSGGLVAGYFTFDYPGHDPHFIFLTRNTFDPVSAIFSRLGIKVDAKQTDKPDKALANLMAALDAGKPAIVIADSYLLPYNNLLPGKEGYGMVPILVYGHDRDTVYIADRARVGLTVTASELAAARARVKKDKHRLLTLSTPDMSQLPSAVKAGIETCIMSYFGDPPVAPLKGKFGLVAFQKWADLLTGTKDKLSWVKYFPPGARLLSALSTGYQSIEHQGTDGAGSRRVYADFLDEAATILDKPALKDAAHKFRAAAVLWNELSRSLLPDDVLLLKETRDLLIRDEDLFMTRGGAALDERKQITARLNELRSQAIEHFPLDDAGYTAFREQLRTKVLATRDAEKLAAEALRDAL